MFDVKSGSTVEHLSLGLNETAVSVATVAFHDRGGEVFVCVGTATDLCLHPRKHGNCYIHVYRIFNDRLSLLHKTEVRAVMGLSAFIIDLLRFILSTLPVTA
jgi:splicing factor 3B subunit 3